MLLKDKVVVISGVGPGLGRKLTLLCVKEGAKVGIGCRNTTFLNDLTEEVKALGGQVVSSPLDVKNNDQCVGLVEATAKAFGRIDANDEMKVIAGEIGARCFTAAYHRDEMITAVLGWNAARKVRSLAPLVGKRIDVLSTATMIAA